MVVDALGSCFGQLDFGLVVVFLFYSWGKRREEVAICSGKEKYFGFDVHFILFLLLSFNSPHFFMLKHDIHIKPKFYKLELLGELVI